MKAWALSDGAAGNERQALALAAALGVQAETVRLRGRWRARLLAPHFGSLSDLDLQPPWPELAIGCGRLAALATRRLREQGVRTVQILDPRIDPALFDAVVAPRHDGLTGANVVATTGSLHGIDDAWLASAREQYAALGGLPGPRTCVLLGGPTRQLRWRRADLLKMATILEHWQARDDGSLMIAASRRTPAWAVNALRARFPDARFALPGDADNAYPGMLAHADRIVVTGDSVNMLSEACAVSVPVLYAAPRVPGERLASFHRDLLERGHARPLRLEYRPWSSPPLRELPEVAAELVRRLGLS